MKSYSCCAAGKQVLSATVCMYLDESKIGITHNTEQSVGTDTECQVNNQWIKIYCIQC